jgi:hypothetical protein
MWQYTESADVLSRCSEVLVISHTCNIAASPYINNDAWKTVGMRPLRHSITKASEISSYMAVTFSSGSEASQISWIILIG